MWPEGHRSPSGRDEDSWIGWERTGVETSDNPQIVTIGRGAGLVPMRLRSGKADNAGYPEYAVRGFRLPVDRRANAVQRTDALVTNYPEAKRAWHDSKRERVLKRKCQPGYIKHDAV